MCVLNTCVLRKSSCKHYRKKNTFSDCRLCGGGCFHKLLSPNTSNIRWRKRKPSSRIFATLAFHATIFCFGCDDIKEDISPPTPKKCDSNSIVQIEDRRQSVWKQAECVFHAKCFASVTFSRYRSRYLYMCVFVKSRLSRPSISSREFEKTHWHH